MRNIVLGLILGLFVGPAHSQEQSTWWQGTFVNADSNSCGNDSQITFEKDGVYPWETDCTIKLITEIREMRGVLLDLDCGYPDSPDDGYVDRLALFELSDDNVVQYSRLTKDATILRRCQDN